MVQPICTPVPFCIRQCSDDISDVRPKLNQRCRQRILPAALLRIFLEDVQKWRAGIARRPSDYLQWPGNLGLVLGTGAATAWETTGMLSKFNGRASSVLHLSNIGMDMARCSSGICSAIMAAPAPVVLSRPVLPRPWSRWLITSTGLESRSSRMCASIIMHSAPNW